ncbi:hypothetical protein P8935_01225 [Telmatobacter sp. DSM 110680]|uniref:DUF2442 domain-containing protein n=1 Tax=Telmatobacter sp. DSM 110680 TaxID=3036704 RepID=A0AAU7DK10_9BACT
MDMQKKPKIVTAEKTRDGVLIEFDDGSAALYPASLLAEVFPQAVKLVELDPNEESQSSFDSKRSAIHTHTAIRK